MSETENKEMVDKATKRSFVLGAILAGVFAWLTVMKDNQDPPIFLSKHLLPALPYLALVVIGLLINPFLKVIRIVRPFSMTEKLQILVMCAVSAGVASFGLVGHMIPLISGLSHPNITNKQSNRDIYAMPYLNEDYFIIEEGTREKAIALKDAHLAWENARKTYRVASDLQSGTKSLEQGKTKLAEVNAMPQDSHKERLLKKVNYSITKANQLLEGAKEQWKEVGEGLDQIEVLKTFPAKISSLKKKRDELREELEAHNLPAAEAVKRVREGLPEGKRAMPGVLYNPGEGSINYWARYDRLHTGLEALESFEKAKKELQNSIEGNSNLSTTWSEELAKSADTLEAIANPEGLWTLREQVVEQRQALEEDLANLQKELREQRNKRRFATLEELRGLDETVANLEFNEEPLKAQVDLLREQEEEQVEPLENMTKFIRETQQEIRYLSTAPIPSTLEAKKETLSKMEEILPSFRSMDASWARYLIGDGEWGLWLGPIFQWLVLVFLGYLIFMTFNNLIYRQWAHHEKLMYPIAELTTILASDGSDPKDRGPVIYKSGLFWFGFSLAAGIYAWNYMAAQNIIPGVSQIKLWEWMGNYVGGSIISGAGEGHFVIIFAVIGIAFLVPSNISFSIWFWEVIAMGVYVVMAWLGYGGGRQSIGNYVRGNLGGGAMLVFGLFTLWTCRHYLICALRPKVLEALETDERKELKTSSWLFLGGMLSLVLMLTIRLEVSLFHTILYMLMAMIITIAMIRAVAEGGVLGLDNHFGSFALIEKIFGTAKAWTAPHLFAPLMVYNSLLVGSLKGFIAPGMANAFKVRERMRIRRLSFHMAVWIGIIIAVVVSSVTLIILSYDVGANNMNKWLLGQHGHAPGISGVMSTPNLGNPKETPWIYAGAIIMICLLVARRSVFWLPHPIGMVLFINPVMLGFWASFMFGWMAKSMVSKYCSEEQYLTIRCFFVGLIVGHLFAALCGWERMSWHFG